MNANLTRRTVLGGAVGLAATAAGSGLLTSCARGPGAPDGSGAIRYLNASSGQEPALKKLHERYRQQTGVEITIETIAQDYDQALRARAQARDVPDLYYPTLGGTLNDHAPYVKAGLPLDLTDAMSDGWRDSFSPELLAYTSYQEGNPWDVEPGIYSVPFDGNCWLMLCNPELWRQAGLDPDQPPTEWDGFLAALKQLKKVTAQPFGMNPAQSYGPQAFVLTFGSNVMGLETVIATVSGDHPWTSPEWRTVFGLYEELRAAEVLAPGSATWTMPDVEKAFFAQKNLATAFSFSSSVAVGQRLAEGFTDYSAFVPPTITTGEIWVQGGKSKSIAVNANSPHVAAILDYLRWFTDIEQQREYARALPTIPVNPAARADADGLDPRIVPFAAQMSKILPPQATMQTPVADAVTKGVQQLLVADNDVDRVLAEIQAAQDGQ